MYLLSDALKFAFPFLLFMLKLDFFLLSLFCNSVLVTPETQRNVTSTKLLKRRKKEESMIRHKEKKQKYKPKCIGKKMHVEEALTHVEPSLNQVPPVEDQFQREKSNVQMGKKKSLLKRSWDSQETEGEMKSQKPRRLWVTHSLN
eukprot:Gb_05181 [translate_table: standard]